MKLGVAPFTGAWIEMTRGVPLPFLRIVAPFTGAWIEMIDLYGGVTGSAVAPFTGAWIEMIRTMNLAAWCGPSHPSRVRGLK